MATNVGTLQYLLEVVDKKATATLATFNSETQKATQSVVQLDNANENLSKSFGDVEKSTRKASSEASNSLGRFSELGTKLQNTGKNLTTFVTLPIAGLGVAFTKVAGDAAETQNKFDVTFQNTREEANKWAEDLGNALGRSTTSLQQFSSTTANILQPLGFAEEESLKLSQSMTQLALDVASFNNASDADVIRAFNSALTGERESLKTLGIVISEADVAQEALNLGLVKQGEELSKTAKAQATYSLLLQNTQNAQGDLERTQGSFANQLKATQASFQELSVTLGNLLIPIATQVLGVVQDVLTRFQELPDGLQKAIVVFGAIAAAVGPVLLVIGKLATLLPLLQGGITAVGAVFTALTGPIGLAIAAIAALTAGIAFLIIKRKELLDGFKKNFPETFAAISAIIETFKKLISSLGDFFIFLGKQAVRLFNTIKDNWEKIEKVITILLPPVGLVIKAIRLLAKNWDQVFAFTKGVLDNFVSGTINAFNILISSVSGLARSIGAVATGIFKAVGQTIEFAINKIIESVEETVNIAADLAKTVGADDISDKLRVNLGRVSIVAGDFGDIFSEAFGKINDAGADTGKAIAEIGVNTQRAKNSITDADAAVAEFNDALGTTNKVVAENTEGTGKATAATKEQTEAQKALADAYKLVEENQGDLTRSTEDTIQKLADSFQDADRPLTELNEVYKNVTGDIKGQLEELEKAHEDSLGKIKSELEGVTNDLENLRVKFETDTKDSQTKFIEDAAKLVIEATDKRAELQKELEQLTTQQDQAESTTGAVDNTANIQELQDQLAQQEAIIQTAADKQLGLDEEIARQREFNALNDLERLQFKFEQEKLARQAAFDDEQEKLIARQLALELQLQQETEAYQVQKDELVALDQAFTDAFLANIAVREAATKTSVDALVSEYKRLEAAARAAQSAGANIAAVGRAAGFAEGGFTGKGADNQIAGLVHKNEYVIPASILRALPSLVPTLEALRKGQTPTSNVKNINVNVNNNRADAVDSYSQMSRIAWMTRYAF